jgi:hypothetical protein
MVMVVEEKVEVEAEDSSPLQQQQTSEARFAGTFQTKKNESESLQTGVQVQAGGNSPLVRAAARPNLTGGASKVRGCRRPPLRPVSRSRSPD